MLYDVFYANFAHQIISAAIASIFRMILLLLLQEYKMWLAVSPLLHKN